jgi:glycine cleavage system H lipoate-binding protein
MLKTFTNQNVSNQPCWWMVAGVVDYKLCDRNLDCEHCPFDLILQSGSQPKEEATSSGLMDSVFYHPAHVWVRVEDQGNVRVGIDNFAQMILGRAYAVSLPHEGIKIEKGRHRWSVTHKAGETPLIVPLSGEILEVNWKLKQSPSLLNRDPYGAGWAFVMKPTDLRTGLRDLFYGSHAAEWHRAETEKLYALVTEQANTANGALKLPDGGVLKNDFLSELSVEQVRELISSFLPGPGQDRKLSYRHSPILSSKRR